LGIVLLNINPQDNYLEVANIHICFQGAQQLAGLLVGGVAVCVVSIGDEDVEETPALGSVFLLQQGVQLHHQVASKNKSISHGSPSVWMDVPDLPGSA